MIILSIKTSKSKGTVPYRTVPSTVLGYINQSTKQNHCIKLKKPSLNGIKEMKGIPVSLKKIPDGKTWYSELAASLFSGIRGYQSEIFT
jgi:hypothetical protein